jgi:hypothetical protein
MSRTYRHGPFISVGGTLYQEVVGYAGTEEVERYLVTKPEPVPAFQFDTLTEALEWLAGREGT